MKIIERGWRLARERTERELYADLAFAGAHAYSVYEWRGADRDGGTLEIIWVASATGAILSAYEVTPDRCARCGREVHPWPLVRPDGCSPKPWAHCIRQPKEGR